MEKYFEINDNGCNIRCKVYCGDMSAVTKPVLFCHGFGGHKDNKAAAKFAEKALKKRSDAAIITFDWPCHGSDIRKKLRLADCDRYLELVIKYVRERFGCEKLYAYATSFGGYLLLKYISENGDPFDKIALRCPAVNMYDVITGSIITPEQLKTLQKGGDAAVGFDRKINISQQFLNELRDGDISHRDYLDMADGLLIIHGTKDEIVPFEDVRDFAENNLIEFVPAENADHRFVDPRLMDAAIKRIMEFIDLA